MDAKNSNNVQTAIDPTVRRPIRWWPGMVILIGWAAALAWVWWNTDSNHQDRNIRWLIVSVIAACLLLVWAILLARFGRTVRFSILELVLLGAGLASATLRIKGVTGNLVPVLAWRWSTSASVNSDTARRFEPPAPAATPAVTETERGDAEFPQFLGPERNGIITQVDYALPWTHTAPVELWRRPVGPAWSGFAVAHGRAVTQEQRADEETVVCYDARTGAELWVHADRAHYHTTIAGEGPRATPTLSEGKVYTLGATGILNCLDLQTGHVRWTMDVVRDTQGDQAEWGISSSPLVIGNAVFVCAHGNPGRALAAYRATDGRPLWASGADSASYSSPQAASLSGREQILSFNARSLESHDPDSGKIFWRIPWPGGHPHVAQPLLLPGDRVVISSGYGTGAELIHVTCGSDGQWHPDVVWKTIRMKSKFADLIYRDGFIYGLDDGILACLNAETGKSEWKDGRYGHGQLLLLNDTVFVMAENGEAVLVAADPREWRELGRHRLLSGKTWNPPAIAGDLLVVRNDLEAACFRLPLRNSKEQRTVLR